MHAYLITGADPLQKEKEAEKLAKRFKAKILEFPLQKIQDARTLGKFLSLVPIQKTAILIRDVHQSTPDAMNAFLKNLEERQNYIFILTASTKYAVFPTILSRCQVIATKGHDDDKIDKVQKVQIEKFIKLSTAEKLLFIENYNGRGDARQFIDSLLTLGHSLLKDAPPKMRAGGNKSLLASVLSGAFDLKHSLQANTNPLLQLTNFVVSLDE